eukprot:7001662-Pyramimonas_sp.AAC.1
MEKTHTEPDPPPHPKVGSSGWVGPGLVGSPPCSALQRCCPWLPAARARRARAEAPGSWGSRGAPLSPVLQHRRR